MDVSAMHGHLEVVQWLAANRPEGCTTKAMDWAAMEGKLVRNPRASRDFTACSSYAPCFVRSEGEVLKPYVEPQTARRQGKPGNTSLVLLLQATIIASRPENSKPAACPTRTAIFAVYFEIY